MKRSGLKPCRLGSENYTLDAPLTGVINLIKICQGAIILGYPQYEFSACVAKAGTPQKEASMSFPTPWNHIEATLAFQRGIPVLIVAHEGISGGVFDHGVTGQYVLTIDLAVQDWHKAKEFQGMFREWKSRMK